MTVICLLERHKGINVMGKTPENKLSFKIGLWLTKFPEIPVDRVITVTIDVGTTQRIYQVLSIVHIEERLKISTCTNVYYIDALLECHRCILRFFGLENLTSCQQQRTAGQLIVYVFDRTKSTLKGVVTIFFLRRVTNQ